MIFKRLLEFTKYVISLLLILSSNSFSDDFYSKALKDAAITNGFKKPSEINSSFDKEKSKLGKEFFHEKILSFNTKNTCSSCHLPRFSSADGLPNAVGGLATGIGIKRLMSKGAKVVPRNTLPLWGRGGKNFNTFFWDGKVMMDGDKIISQLGLLEQNYATSTGLYSIDVKDNALLTAVHLPFVELRELVEDDEEIHKELKNESIGTAFDIYSDIAKRVKDNPYYSKKIMELYNVELGEITFHNVADAITHFIRDEFAIKETPFSNFVFNNKKLPKKTVKGGLIFYGKGKCASCHSGEFFSDFDFHSIPFPQIGFGKNGFGVDYGRFNITFDPEDLYKFRTPPLYNVERSFPYSHSGSVYSLRKAVIYHFDPLRDFKANDFSEIDRNEYYKKLAASGESIDSIPYLDSEEISSLVDFLKTLTFIKK